MFIAGPKKLITSMLVALFPFPAKPALLWCSVTVEVAESTTAPAVEDDELTENSVGRSAPLEGIAGIVIRSMLAMSKADKTNPPNQLGFLFLIFNPSETNNVFARDPF
jgi:hypothetical protein